MNKEKLKRTEERETEIEADMGKKKMKGVDVNTKKNGQGIIVEGKCLC